MNITGNILKKNTDKIKDTENSFGFRLKVIVHDFFFAEDSVKKYF